MPFFWQLLYTPKKVYKCATVCGPVNNADAKVLDRSLAEGAALLRCGPCSAAEVAAVSADAALPGAPQHTGSVVVSPT